MIVVTTTRRDQVSRRYRRNFEAIYAAASRRECTFTNRCCARIQKACPNRGLLTANANRKCYPTWTSTFPISQDALCRGRRCQTVKTRQTSLLMLFMG
jgi:hypothetical protein